MAGDPHTSHLDTPSEKPNYPLGCAVLLLSLLFIAAFLWFVMWTNKATPLPDAWSSDAFIGRADGETHD